MPGVGVGVGEGDGVEVDVCQRPPPPADNQGIRAFILIPWERATCRNNIVSSDNLLQIGHQWSDQCHLGYFKYSLSSVPGAVCYHCFEANSRYCGSLSHGYSLVISS